MDAVILFILIPFTMLEIYAYLHIEKELRYIVDIIIRHDSLMRSLGASLNNKFNDNT